MGDEEELKKQDEELEKMLKLNYKLKRMGLLRIARTNITYFEGNNIDKHNYDLGKLGDGILKFLVADELCKKNMIKDLDNGYNPTCNKHLKNIVEKRLKITDFFLIGKGAKNNQNLDEHEEHVGNYLEALIAVVYLDSKRNIKKTRDFLINSLDILNIDFD